MLAKKLKTLLYMYWHLGKGELRHFLIGQSIRVLKYFDIIAINT